MCLDVWGCVYVLTVSVWRGTAGCVCVTCVPLCVCGCVSIHSGCVSIHRGARLSIRGAGVTRCTGEAVCPQQCPRLCGAVPGCVRGAVPVCAEPCRGPTALPPVPRRTSRQRWGSRWLSPCSSWPRRRRWPRRWEPPTTSATGPTGRTVSRPRWAPAGWGARALCGRDWAGVRTERCRPAGGAAAAPGAFPAEDGPETPAPAVLRPHGQAGCRWVGRGAGVFSQCLPKPYTVIARDRDRFVGCREGTLGLGFFVRLFLLSFVWDKLTDWEREGFKILSMYLLQYINPSKW